MRKPAQRGNETKEKILNAGIKLWIKDPSEVTPSHIGRMLKMSHSLVIYHFPKGIKDAVAHHALKNDVLPVIGLLIAGNHKVIGKLSDKEKQSYIQRIWGGF